MGADLQKAILDERIEKSKGLILEEIERYNIIKDPLQFKLSEKDITFVKKIEKEIPLKIHHLSEQQWVQFSELFTYNTNAIEGSELNSKEVKEILEEDKWPEEKSKQDIAEAYGVNEAIKYIREIKEELGIELKEYEYFTSISDRYLYQGVNKHLIGIKFITKLSSDTNFKPSDDILSAKFFPVENIPWDKLAFENVKKVLEKFQK